MLGLLIWVCLDVYDLVVTCVVGFEFKCLRWLGLLFWVSGLWVCLGLLSGSLRLRLLGSWFRMFLVRRVAVVALWANLFLIRVLVDCLLVRTYGCTFRCSF